VKLKIVVGFYMIATQLPDVYEVDLPPTVRNVLSTFAFGISFGFAGLDTVLECMDLRGYVPKLAIFILVPLFIALLIVCACWGRLLVAERGMSTSRLLAKLLSSSAPYLLQLAFLSYPLVTNCAFGAFSCFDFLDSEWLKADVAIQCRTRQHADAKALAVVAIILYPVGLLLLTAALLFASRAAIRTKRPTTLSCAIAFLHREYEPQFFWWELVEMLRRLVLVGLMVLVQGSMMQIVVGTLLSAAFLLFQVQASPYLELSDDFLASVCSFFLVVVVVCSYAFKDFEFVGLPDIVEKMSREQKGVYVIDQGALIGVIILSVVGAIVISAGIFVVQFVVVGARLQREELARKARRLRMKSNDEEVLVEPIGEGLGVVMLACASLNGHVSLEPLGVEKVKAREGA